MGISIAIKIRKTDILCFLLENVYNIKSNIEQAIETNKQKTGRP